MSLLPQILLIEDNARARKMVQVTLESAGYRVVAASNARTAIDLMAQGPADLVLQDMLLPDMDGFELVRKLRSLPGGAEVPIVAYSGFLSRQEEARVTAAGFTNFLVKPVEPSRLLETIRTYLPLPSTSSPQPGRGRRLLVADDDPSLRKLLATRLTYLGFEVDTAKDGEEALEKAVEHPPDAIASDLLMPQLNGFGLCLAARREPTLAKVPIVLFSGSYGEESDVRFARSVGANALVLRTPDLSDLTKAILASLEGPPAAVVSAPGAARPEPPTDRLNLRAIQRLERQAAAGAGLVQQCSIQAACLSVLGGVSDALARSADANVAMLEALAACLEAGGISLAAVFTRGLEGSFELHAQAGCTEADLPDLASLFGHVGLLRRVDDSQAPLAVQRATDGTSEGGTLLARSRMVSVLLAPISLRGERLGVLVMAAESRDLGEPDWLAFGRTLAVQIAQAIVLTRAFQRLSSPEARQPGLLERASEAVFVVDPQGVVLEANERGEDLLGGRQAQLTGRRVEAFHGLATDERAQRLAVPLVRADGTIARVDLSSIPLHQDGVPVSLVVAREIGAGVPGPR